MVDNGIKSLVPSEQYSGSRKNTYIQSQDHIEGINVVLLGKKDRDEVCSAGSGIEGQTQGNDKSVDDSSEYADQKKIICNSHGRYYINQESAEKNDNQGIPGKLLPDVTEADIDRNCIAGNADGCVGNVQIEKAFQNGLDKNGKTGSPAWIKTADLDEDADVDGIDDGCEYNNERSEFIAFDMKRHLILFPLCSALYSAESGS